MLRAYNVCIVGVIWLSSVSKLFYIAAIGVCRAGAMISVNAHEADVNVLSWSHMVTYMLASGGDDGAMRVWDLRNIKEHGHVVSSVLCVPSLQSFLGVSHPHLKYCLSLYDIVGTSLQRAGVRPDPLLLCRIECCRTNA